MNYYNLLEFIERKQKKEQLNRIKTWLFGLIQKKQSGVQPTMIPPSIEALTSSKLYQNTHELPLLVFIDIIENDDITKLIIEGVVEDSVLLETWESIIQDYSNTISGKQAKFSVKQMTRLAAMDNKLSFVEATLELLSENIYTDGLFKQLYMYKYDIPTLTPSKENLAKIFPIFKGFYMDERIRYDNEAHEVNKDKGKQQKSKIDRTFFDEMVVAIQFQLKVQINIKELSTKQFAIWVNTYRSFIEKSNQEISKLKKR